MNSYIVNLVKKDVTGRGNLDMVKCYDRENSYLIYNTQQFEPYFILFEDYMFKITDNSLKVFVGYSDLQLAINYLTRNNKG